MQSTNIGIANAATRETTPRDASPDLGRLLSGAKVDQQFIKGPAIGTAVGEAAPPSFSSMQLSDDYVEREDITVV